MRTDAELLAAARTDAGAVRELYERYSTRVHGYHRRRSRDAAAAHDLTAETLAIAGTEPTCTVVRENVEYHCTLERAPAPEVLDWKGTVEPTVDATKHVNGGCRSLASDGKTWQCYIGQEAVRQEIIAPQFLGDYAPPPGVG